MILIFSVSRLFFSKSSTWKLLRSYNVKTSLQVEVCGLSSHNNFIICHTPHNNNFVLLEFAIQAALVICGLFICNFAYMRLKNGLFSGTYPLFLLLLPDYTFGTFSCNTLNFWHTFSYFFTFFNVSVINW